MPSPADLPGPPEPPARALDEALARMRWTLLPGEYRLAAFGPDLDLAALARALAPSAGCSQVTLEPGEVTVLGPAAVLEPFLARHPAARVERDLAWIRFEAPMGWELVGFLAHVCARMAAAGVPLGAVCSFDRDHLFVARRHLEAARGVLEELFPGRELR